MEYKVYISLLCVILCSTHLGVYSQRTSLQVCEASSQDTNCLIDFISQKSQQQTQLMIQNIERICGRISQNSCPQIPQSCEKLARDCRDVQRLGNTESGLYTIHPFLLDDPLQVYCDMYTDGGGWTVLQRRQDGSVNFTRNWDEYRDGFGDPMGEMWIGNKYIRAITEYSAQEMRVDLGDWDDNRVFAKYARFHVASEQEKFRLNIGTYSGTAGNSLHSITNQNQNQNGHFFSTIDRDNDNRDISCSVLYQSGFWFNNCYYAKINGLYKENGQTTEWQGIIWYHWKGEEYSLKFTEMKVRPVT